MAASGHKQPLGSLSFHRLLSSAYRPLTGQIFQVYVLSVCFHQERPLDRANNDGADRLLTAISGHPNFVELPAMVSGDFFFSKSQKAGGIVVQNVALLLVSEK